MVGPDEEKGSVITDALSGTALLCRNHMKLKKIALAVLILASTASQSAHAHFEGAMVVTAIQMQTMELQQFFSQQYARMTNSIVQELRKIQNGLNASSSKIAETVNQTGDNIVKRAIDQNYSNRIVDAERNTKMPIDPCANGSLGMADPDFSRTNPGFKTGALKPRFGGGSPGGVSTGSAQLDTAIKISNGEQPAPSPEVQAMMAQSGACQVYASGTRADSCKASGISTGKPRLPNADVLASSVFSGAQTASDIIKGITSMSFDDDQMAAANAYLRNVNNPVDLRELTATESKTDEGRRYLALRDAHKARLDMANQPAVEWLSNRAKFDGTIPVITAMLEGQGAAAEYLRKELPRTAPDWNKKGISLHHLMSIESSRRYRNPEWLKEIAKTSDPLTLQREQLMLNAMMADMMTKQLMATERANVLLGVIYQASLNKDFMPEVLAQFRKATATR